MRQVDPRLGRYVRITLKDGLRDFSRRDPVEITLGEIELLENGKWFRAACRSRHRTTVPKPRDSRC